MTVVQLTDRDRELLAFVAEHRIVLGAHVQALLEVSPKAARGRLRSLTAAGLLRRVPVFHRPGDCHQITGKGLAVIGSRLPRPRVDLHSYEHSLRIDEDDAARVRHLEHDIPLTAAEEDRIRRKKAFEEAAKVRKIYEELVLKKKSEPLMQIGTMDEILSAVPGTTVKRPEPANGNGATAKPEAAGVAGD